MELTSWEQNENGELVVVLEPMSGEQNEKEGLTVMLELQMTRGQNEKREFVI